MAIENMSRFQLYIFDKDRKPLLKRLQKFADVHFVDVRRNAKDDDVLPAPDVSLEWQQTNEVISKVQWMLQLLEPYKEKPGMITGLERGCRRRRWSNYTICRRAIPGKNSTNICRALIRQAKTRKTRSQTGNRKWKNSNRFAQPTFRSKHWVNTA